MHYAVFFVVLAAIPAILNLRSDNEVSVTQVLLLTIGSVGFIYNLYKAWFAASGSMYYLVLAGFAFLLAVIAGINLILNIEIAGISSNECFVSLFILAIFVIMILISVLKAWFVISPNGYMDYLRFACIWGICAFLICVGVLVGLIFTHNNSKGEGLILGCLGFFFLMEMIYSLLKAWDALPSSAKYEIIGTVLLIFFLLIGGAGSAASVGSSGHQSK